MAEGINPVTFTGLTKRVDGTEIKLSVGRMHIGSKNRDSVQDGMHRLEAPEVVKKYVTCVLWRGDGKDMESLGEIVIDEDHLIRGLKHLFPNGELDA